ncbi:hypothetical protein LTR37_004245 [Vermiconidia calcicola]|uniref:Uncharacterized protein n=1 Tax=Vermiconidia calcicola TaxID=1690605 RepID=A0ACC3NQP5_9PEZI|nr:hypothetical protein LTR37_004245 [Vermiconidia calcicola]
MDTSSSSKVTVEYHDPSGIFPLVSRDVASRLPLQNLTWKSPTRPVRHIKSLHLDFVPDSFTRDGLRLPVQHVDSNGATSLDIVRSGADPRKNAIRERKHQIPGLQTSPYLKIYILRADDKETYKSTERKKIREWIRDNVAASTKGKGENHDGFEWLIVHVVVPDTVAASEPRWRESSAKDSDELKERKQGMKLPGKSTRTTFDKLRADFDEPGKRGQDRVAQIRLNRAQVSADLLPTPAMATTIEETNEEREKAWNDLTEKMKALILGPLDLRIRQYEADVTEQESRRSLPGFNFCTFFIHKEGLAKALESIGLVEDALVIYDELSLGFETVLKDIARGQAEGTATTFAPFTDDIIERITGSAGSETNGVRANNDKVQSDTDNAGRLDKDYRERIVRSDISVFDFSCYIFSRQNALILRLANARAARTGLGSGAREGSEDLVLISEVCWRAANFIHNNARALRQDLAAYRSSQWERRAESPISGADIDSLVCSWTYIIAGQMLEETYSSTLDQAAEHGTLQNGSVTGPNQEAGGVHEHPQRTTSLPARKSRITELQGRESLQSASSSDLMSPPPSPGVKGGISTGTLPGLIELVTYRAELLMMQRKMLEQIARQRDWYAGWALMGERVPASMEDVDLNGNLEPNTKQEKTQRAREESKYLAPPLELALRSRDTFHETYERLSDMAMRYYLAATQSKRAESIMGDLAIVKYQQSDYGYAASYFQHVLPFYAEEGWSLMEVEALRMHAMCLKELDRKREYVVTLLALVAKACGWRRAQRLSTFRTPTFDEMAHVAGVLPDVLAFSDNLDAVVSNPAEAYFSDIELEREVLHYKDKDGFALHLRFRHLLDDELELDEINARLVHVDDQNTDIWLSSSAITLTRGINEVRLESFVVAFGPFIADRIVFKAGKVAFVHELLQKPKTEPTPLGISDLEDSELSDEAHNQPRVFVYPTQHAFKAEVSLSRHVHINEPRHLEVRLSSGWNEITSLDLRLKPASAGLRLHLADSLLDGVEVRNREPTKAGQLSLGSLQQHKTATSAVPYTLEHSGLEVFVRLEVNYTTAKGSFVFLTSARLPTQLPLDVDVNDTFNVGVLFSNFTVRATQHTPLSITEASLKPSAVYDVEVPPVLPMPMTVFEKQPVRLIYKITRKPSVAAPVSKKAAALALSVHYHLVDDVIFSSIRDRFAAALADSPFARFMQLLPQLLFQRLQQIFSNADIEVALLLCEAKVPFFEEVGWYEIISALPVTVREGLAEWLRSWHSNNTHLTIGQDAAASELQRSIVISVDVPNVDFVHQASLSLSGQQHGQDSQVLTLGQPLQAQLSITSTSRWSTGSIFQADRKEQDDVAKDFISDIQTDPDRWLVGGQRRRHFKAADGGPLTFDVVLVPLTLGAHPLPGLDIQAEQTSGTSEEGNTAGQPPSVSCETHYESAAQVVQVVRDSRTSRVHIAESPSSARPTSRPSTATTVKEPG